MYEVSKNEENLALMQKVLNENKEMYTDISYKEREYTIVSKCESEILL